jgi:histidyl-tRNA synthetase
LICYFDKEAEFFSLKLLYQLRNSGINSEIYPEAVKIKKQLEYADRKKIPYVIIIGTEEIQSHLLTLKDMKSGEQYRLNADEIIKKITNES